VSAASIVAALEVRLSGVVSFTLFMGHLRRWRFVAESVDDREPAAAARDPRVQFHTGQAGSVSLPLAPLVLLPDRFFLGGHRRLAAPIGRPT
jgi:hypothetical protein